MVSAVDVNFGVIGPGRRHIIPGNFIPKYFPHKRRVFESIGEFDQVVAFVVLAADNFVQIDAERIFGPVWVVRTIAFVFNAYAIEFNAIHNNQWRNQARIFIGCS